MLFAKHVDAYPDLKNIISDPQKWLAQNLLQDEISSIISTRIDKPVH
jgi:hypothetical protein